METVASGDRFRARVAAPGDAAAAEAPVEVRLAEIRAAREGADGAAARAFLQDLLGGGEVRLESPGLAQDRYGRRLAHVHRLAGAEDAAAPEVWAQGALVSAGHALAWSYADNHARAPELLALEAGARAARRGAWGTGGFAVLDPDPERLAQHLDGPAVVEGVVVSAARARAGDLYLNFGLDWGRDFTVRATPQTAEALAEAGLGPEALEGARVRVRGWLFAENGPMIALDHTAPLEVLDDAARPRLLPAGEGG